MGFSLVRKPRRSNDVRSPKADSVVQNIPLEIVLPANIKGMCEFTIKQPHEEKRATDKKSAILKRGWLPRNKTITGSPVGITRHPSDSTRALTVSTKHKDDTTSVGWSKYSLGCRGVQSVRHGLWKSAVDNHGPISRVDELCRDQVVSLMSRNDATRKKLLDEWLNHGEF